MLLKSPTVSVLGQDPDRVHRINANSFQQNAITTVNGWQYATFYSDLLHGKKHDCCYVNMARRKATRLAPDSVDSEWETFAFTDYQQVHDDGHNTISIGVCKEDGTIHVSFDHHCDELRFRVSKLGLAQNPEEHAWDASLFSTTQNSLPGLPASEQMIKTTYPRFVIIGNDLLFTYRIGEPGCGSDVLYRYSAATHGYTYLGQYLTGSSNNPYINGIDFRLSRIHVSWCYRNFIEFPSTLETGHKQHAGPNGPENNKDFYYTYSDDLGETWKSSEGEVMANLIGNGEDGAASTIKADTKGAKVFDIPMGSGILNQEAQAPDWLGGFWALNRQKIDGIQTWMVYYRNPRGNWSKRTIESTSKPTETGARASVCVDRENNVYLILPGNSDSSLEIQQARAEGGYKKFESVWRCEVGYDGEPLVDVQRLEVSDILSIFTRTTKDNEGRCEVVVLDFTLLGTVKT